MTEHQINKLKIKLLLKKERERVSPKMELFRDKSIGGSCDDKIIIKGARGGRGAGAKCLKVGTKIWMFDGTLKEIQDIKIGDLVMGMDSLPRKVLNISFGYGKLYKIKQAKAIDYVVNEEHVLTLKKVDSAKNDKGPFIKYGYKRPNGSYARWPDIVDIPLKEYFLMSNRWKYNFIGMKSDLIKYAKKMVQIPPYILGVWLGDGNSNNFGLTTMDNEVLLQFRKYAFSLNLNENIYSGRSGKAKTYIYSKDNNTGPGSPIFSKLRYYNLINNKHIPIEYLNNSEKNRLDLLAGIIDTDGTLRKSKSGYSICQSAKRYNLILDIRMLAASLGFRTSITKGRSKCNNKYFDYYKINISGNIWKIPCKIPRKVVKKEEYKRKSDHNSTYIKVEEYGYGDYAGIEVDGDNRILLEDGTITHNSSGFVSLIVQEANFYKHRIACLREIQGTLEESVYENIQETVDKLRYPNWHFTREHIITPTDSRFIFRGLKDLRASRNIKGLQGFTRFFVEEADPVSIESWDFLLPTLFRNKGAKLYFAYNQMTDTDPVTIKIWDMFKNDPFALMIEMLPGKADNPWFNDTMQMLSDKMKSMDPDLWDHVYGGQPMAQLANAILSRVLVRQAMDRNIKDPDGAIEVGCDPADEGDDKTKIYIRKGLKIIERKTLKKQNGIYIANEINRMIKGDPSIPIKLDTTGIGVSTRDRLRELGLKVIPIHWGSAATKPDEYPNIASELWFDFQEVLPYIDIPDDPELMADLSKRLYSYDSKGRRCVQPKKDFKKENGGRSPDDGDALLLCFFERKNIEFDDNVKDWLLRQRTR